MGCPPNRSSYLCPVASGQLALSTAGLVKGQCSLGWERQSRRRRQWPILTEPKSGERHPLASSNSQPLDRRRKNNKVDLSFSRPCLIISYSRLTYRALLHLGTQERSPRDSLINVQSIVEGHSSESPCHSLERRRREKLC
jgi:hypothetical protein